MFNQQAGKMYGFTTQAIKTSKTKAKREGGTVTRDTVMNEDVGQDEDDRCGPSG